MKKNFSFLSKALKHFILLAFLCAFNQALATVSATISGTATICSGGSTTLSVALTGGTTPWKFTWSDGTTHHAVTGVSTSPYTFSVSPTVNTTYTIVSDSDAANTAGTVHGSAIVTVQMPAGTYTINPSGSGSTNYTTFNAALSDLTSRGICGAVTFNVSNGTYNEQLIIPAITGSSSANTITFQSASGDSSAVILTEASSSTAGAGNCTVCMNGGSYITFNKLTIQRTGTLADAIVLYHHSGVSHNNKYTNNRIICGSTTSNNIDGMESSDSAYGFSHNYIQGGADGIYWFNIGTANNMFKYNTITDFSSCGIYVRNLVNTLILGNDINQPETTGTNGIKLDGQNKGTVVEKNIIYLNNEGNGIVEGVDTAASANPNIIANNFITIGDTSIGSNTGGMGIYSFNNSYEYIYYNSINMVDKKSSTTSVGLKLTSGGSIYDSIYVRNNIVSTTSGGEPITVTVSGGASTSFLNACNYNDYYTRGTHIGTWAGTNETTLANWRTASGKDANSLNINPFYITDTTNLYTFNPSLKQATPLSAVADDINGTTRNATNPYIGAYEITPTAVNGSTTVCANTTIADSTPYHSGSSYAWTISGISGTTYSGAGISRLNVVWGGAGTGTLKVVETNGLYKDSATASITVNASPSANAGSSSSICNGGSAGIGASSVGTDTYSWTSSPSGFTSTSSSATVSPTTTTTYTLTETILATGCTHTNPVVVTVNPLPSANAGSAHSVCKGSNTSIGASSTSGHTYSWTSSPSGFTSTVSNPSISPTIITTYTLTETITATGCNKSNSVVISINPVPNSILDSSDVLICKGDTVEIGDDSTVGYSYSWSASPSGYTPTGVFGYVSPTLTTTYLLTETITATGCAKTDTIIATVNPIPSANIGSASTICEFSTASIGSTAVSGNLYFWYSKPAGFGSDTSSPTVSPLTTTTYYLTEVAPAGCSKSDSVIITVHSAPEANVGTDSIIYNCDAGTNSITIGATTISGHTYSWTSSPSGFTSTSANPTISPTVNTTYYLTEIITATSCAKTNSLNVHVLPENTQIKLKLHYTQTH